MSGNLYSKFNIFKKIDSNFFRDSFWALLGNVVLRGSGLLVSIFLARLLSKTDYGIYNSLKNTFTSLAVFTTFGLGYASTKFIADGFREQLKIDDIISKIYKITSYFGFTISILVFVFSNFISEFYYNNSSFTLELKALSIWILLTAITTSQNGIIAGLGKFKDLSKIYFILGITTLLLSYLFTIQFDLIGALISLIIIQIFNVIINGYFIRRKASELKGKVVKNISYKTLLRYSLPLTLIEGVNAFSLFFNYFLLQHNGTYGEVGLYSATMQWYILLVFIPSVLKNVMLSHFSRNDSKEKMLKMAMLISFFCSLVPCISIFLFSSLIENLYGPNLKGISFYIKIISILPLISSIAMVVEQYMFSISRNWLVFFICCLKDLGTSILFFIFIQLNNLDDIVMELVLSYIIMNAIALLIYLIVFMYKKSSKIQTF